jgi:hypothetical protein
MKYVTLPFNKKLNLLREHSMGCDWPDLDQEHWCLHCSKKFNGHSARVWQSKDGSHARLRRLAHRLGAVSLVGPKESGDQKLF